MYRIGAVAVALLCGVAFTAQAQVGGFKVLHDFTGGSDGAGPQADLIAVGPTLYGTTVTGGSANSGTVFAISLKTGAERVVHSFGAGGDAAFPVAGLLQVGHTLYGTTEAGGSAGQGAVYSLDLTTGAETVLYSFQGGGDGDLPQGRLIVAGGTLYGTAMMGGSQNCYLFGCGTVFSIDLATGAEKTVYQFQNGADGANPNANVTYVGGRLSGTTISGGDGDAGTLFALDLATGQEAVLHNFDRQGDGTNPISGVIDFGGTLYGASIAGGYGLGVVYAYNLKTGDEHVVDSFARTNGALPEDGVIEAGGTLSGTTSLGGAPNDGVVFSLDPASGAERVLHVFLGPDGANPWAGVIKVGATLYGTTLDGGSAGAGVVFAITSSPYAR